MTFETNVRFSANIEVGIDEELAQKWIAKTIIDARNILNIGMRDGPQTGVRYEKANGIVHQASRAGQWPAVDTGNLRINTRIRIDALEGEIGSNVEYAEYLEFPKDQSKARKLYTVALNMAIEDNIDDLGEVIFIRSGDDTNQ